MNIHLDARLQAVYDMVPPCGTAADIGCDHAYLSCALAETGRSRRVLACEANPGPLLSAQKTIRENWLSPKVDTVLTNGLAGLPYQEIDTFIIAGMGGELIADIILSHTWTRDSRFCFILNPMTKEDRLRQALLENGFIIEKESCVHSVDRLYIVMYVSYTDINHFYSPVNFLTGCHLESGDSSSVLYVDLVVRRLRRKIQGLKKAGGHEYAKTADDYTKLLNAIEAKRYRG